MRYRLSHFVTATAKATEQRASSGRLWASLRAWMWVANNACDMMKAPSSFRLIVPDTNWAPRLSTVGRSKYKAVAEAIREGIMSGQLAVGAKLPPVRELAYVIGVTPGTVARAYSLMIDEGSLSAEVGRGTFVAGRTRVKQVSDVPLINTVDETNADFRSSRVLDVGQGLLIDDAMMFVAQSHRRSHINYPTQETDLEVREAIIDWLSEANTGPIDADHIVLAKDAQNACIMSLLAILSGPAPVILTEDLAYLVCVKPRVCCGQKSWASRWTSTELSPKPCPPHTANMADKF